MKYVLSKSLLAAMVKDFAMADSLASDPVANEEAIRAHVDKCVSDGKIKMSKVYELSEESEVPAGVKMINDAVAAANAPVVAALAGLTAAMTKAFSGNTGGQTQPGNDTSGSNAGQKAYQQFANGGESSVGGGQPDKVDARVKSIAERFRIEKSFLSVGDAKQSNSIQVPVSDSKTSRTFDGISELDRAVVGATMKWFVSRAANAGLVDGGTPAWAKMTEQDEMLMKYAAHEMDWNGPIGMREEDGEHADHGWAKGARLNQMQIKAVLDDTTSGGLEAVPIVFDDLAVITPLLHSELLQYVDQRLTNSRRVESFRINNPDMYWEAEGVSATEFDTTGFIGEFNTNIHPCIGWIDLGLDFESDSPVAIANLIINRYGEVARKKLDDVIANGTGVGQPLGIRNTVGLTTVVSPNGATGPALVDDYELLQFGVPKEFRAEASRERFRFLANDVSYMRARGIAVGVNDQRRVFGMDQRSYELLGMPYSINHSLPNTFQAAVCLNRYVLYRRAGFSIRSVTEDKDLAIQNKRRLVMRMRYGGQLNHGKAAAIITNGMA
jgi:HK97 family phage major capsid protein